MSKPDVPLRMEVAFEVPGTPAEIWEAIATANGITAWFMRTEIEERAGGKVVFHLPSDHESRGEVTAWDPPRRIEYVEPDWATLGGQAADAVTPLVTEFLVEARSGGTCVVRVVSSAFGRGADWEQEFFDEMLKGWVPFFDNMRVYLDHFAGRPVTPMSVQADVRGTGTEVLAAIRRELGGAKVGDPVEVRDIKGEVEAAGDTHILVRTTEPLPGFAMLYAYDKGDGESVTAFEGRFFSDNASAYVAQEVAAWQAWLERLPLGKG
jgi:uncharacterized protein YndB with AHSA1/START domain